MRFVRSILLIVILSGAAVSSQAPVATPSPSPELTPTPAEVGKPSYRVIVHAGNPVSTVERRFLEEVFLKKRTTWTDGETILPVDLASKVPVRQTFSVATLNRPVAAVKNYWQQRIFSGRGLPPPELDTEEQVVMFVKKHSGAIGYVSVNTDITGVKAVTVR